MRRMFQESALYQVTIYYVNLREIGHALGVIDLYTVMAARPGVPEDTALGWMTVSV